MAQGKSALGIVRKYYPEVTKVRDAKKNVTIAVTPDDCKGSRKKSPSSCALARACERSYDGAIVSMSVAYLVKGNVAHRYRVPQAISRELVSFDRHHDFAPGEYRLKAPSKTQKMGPRKWAQPENRPSGREYGNGGNKQRHHRTAGIRAL